MTNDEQRSEADAVVAWAPSSWIAKWVEVVTVGERWMVVTLVERRDDDVVVTWAHGKLIKEQGR